MKNKKILIMVAVILLIVIIGVIGFTFAKYQSIGKSNINPKVAKWHVLVNDVDISDGKTKTFDANIDWNQNDNIYNNGKTLIAPGSKGVVSFDIDARESQVSVKYNIKLDTSELTNHKQIKITKITSTQDEKETIINETEELNGLINLEEINKPVTIKVYIEWDPDINDEDDYNLGTKDIPLSIGVEVTISQKVNNTLAETIINNAKEHKNADSTIYSPQPLTTPAQQVSGENERTLSMTEDDYGNSYYFRGNVIDNYLNFNNMCWRIVRIEGDGSIKLILYDKNSTCKNSVPSLENTSIDEVQNITYGYKEENKIKKADYENCAIDTETCMKNKFESWFEENFENKKDKLKKETWQLGNQTTKYNDNGVEVSSGNYYEVGSRINTNNQNKYATLIPNKAENNKTYTSYISTLTADEVTFAGAAFNNQSNTSYYLWVDNLFWWTLSLYYQSNNALDWSIYVRDSTKNNDLSTLNAKDVTNKNMSVRPSIVLIPNIELIQGDGTKENPYTI